MAAKAEAIQRAFEADGQRAGATELDPHDLLRILRRRKWVILGTMATILAVVLLYIWRTTPLYTAVTTLEVVTAQQAPLDGAVAPLTPQDEIRINTHLELLVAPTLGEAVVKDLDLAEDEEFRPDPDKLVLPSDPEEAEAARMALVVEKLFDRVTVGRVGQSALIRVMATTSDPEKSAEIANIVAGTHRKSLLKESRSATSQEIQSLEARAGELRAEAIEGERAALAQGQQAGLHSGSAVDASGQAASLAAQLTDAKAQRAAAETRFGQLGGIGGGATGAGLGASPLLADLRAQQAALEKQVAELSAQFGPGHPDMQRAEAQRAGIAARLAEEMVRVRREAAAEVAAARAREGQIAADLGTVRAREMRAGEVSVGMSDLQHSAATNRNLYLSQLARLQELRGKEQSIRPEISIAAKALVPTAPSSPQGMRLIVASICGGLILGIILAFAVELFDRKLRTADQVSRITGMQTLAMIPELSRGQAAVSPALLLQREPTGVYSESIRALCLDLVGRRPGAKRCVLITSPLPQEGKTMLATSLGASAALLGRKSIVVDFDLRRPAVPRTLHLSAGSPDLIDCLEGQGALDPELASAAVLQDPGCPRLSILAASRLPTDPGDLLASPRVSDLIQHLKRRFDFVVLNAPPILPVRDAKYLAMLADATILVVRWGRTSPEALKASYALLGRWATAAVINRVDVKRHAASHYGDRLQYYPDYASYFAPAPEEERPVSGADRA